MALDVAGRPVSVVIRTGDAESRVDRERFAVEAATLTIANHHRLPVPRLLAVDLDGASVGSLALVRSVVEGSSRIPRVASRDRLRALGAAAGLLQRVDVRPGIDVPMRTRPVARLDFAADRVGVHVPTLLCQAEAAVEQYAPHAGPTVLVHGDFWQGNTIWVGDRLVGIIDWDCGGAGAPGLDLGSLRLDAAILYGLDAVDWVLEGWRDATGLLVDDMAYWDLTAALSTPVDMVAWIPAIHEEGRADLDGPTLCERRDMFIAQALNRLTSRQRAH